jgi:hypothetical protein
MTFVEESLRDTARALFGSQGRVLPMSKLLELGWEDLVAEEPEAAVRTLAEEQGRRLGSSRIAELEMARRLGIDSRSEALAFALGASACSAEVDAVLLADTTSAKAVVVPVAARGVVLCRVPAAALAIAAVEAIDPSAGWRRVRGRLDPDAGKPIDEATWSATIAAGRLALAHEMMGLSAAMLAIAVAHVKDRQQFGVPIGSFQAVQHRLADTHVQIEAARAIARTAWIDQDRFACAAALSASRQAIELATEHCHQVLGALACSWEHDLHRYIRRGLLLSLLLDPAADLRAAVRSAVVSPKRVEVLS